MFFHPVDAYTESGNAFYCANCTDCTNALNNNTYNTVYLNASTPVNDTCINNPENFTSKIFDCQSYSMTGNTSGYGIYLDGKDNNTINNCILLNFSRGVSVNSSDNTTIANNTINSYGPVCNVAFGDPTKTYGIYLSSSSYSLLSNNTLQSNSYGSVNFCGAYSYGIYLESSSNNTLVNNNASHSNSRCTVSCMTRSYGIYLMSSPNNNILSNTASLNNASCIGSGSGCGASTADGMYIDSSDNIIIAGNTISSNRRAGLLTSASDNTTIINNTINSNLGNGFWIISSNNTIVNNTAISNAGDGFSIGSSNNTLINNTAISNAYGLGLSENNTVVSNTLEKNLKAVYSSGYLNSFTSNTLSKNMKTFFNFSTSSQKGVVGSAVNFNFTMVYVNGSECPACSYQLELNPSESSLQSSPAGSFVSGSFTPARKGIYSLLLTVTDPQGNSEARKHIYLINGTESSVTYYFRSQLPTHYQPVSEKFIDAGSLLREAPTSDEYRYCGDWIQFSVDILPDYIFGIYEQVNYSIRYRLSVNGTTGTERYVTYGRDTDVNTFALQTGGVESRRNFNFSVDWPADYSWMWYEMSIKLNGSSANPYIYTNSTDISYANITYSYSATPAIKNISNEDIDILSATMPADGRNETEIVLDGEGATNLTIIMPGQLNSTSYFVTFDGANCSLSPDCNYTMNGTEVNISVNLGSEHTVKMGDIKAEGLPCTVAIECSVDYCVHSFCRSTSTYCGDSYCDTGETCNACSQDCGSCPGGASHSRTYYPPAPADEGCSHDSNCSDNEYCSDGECLRIKCVCGYLDNHACIEYECCEDSDCHGNQKCEGHKCVAYEEEIADEQLSEANITTTEEPRGQHIYNFVFLGGIIAFASIIGVLLVLHFTGTLKHL
ncbi:MAG: right-handed parallel beta-helix repeat-containing protein [Candidatus Aenigmarchaeota archaeon]|nr:right-handed parallel beta-helix repeat-containing protein [Candidatus Aenigmarchaeota archaeon]